MTGRRPGTVKLETHAAKGHPVQGRGVAGISWPLRQSGSGRTIRAGQRTRILTLDEQPALLAAYDKGRRQTVKPIIELL